MPAVNLDPCAHHRYQVATETGWPSGRTVVITAGLGLASIALACGDKGGLGTACSLRSCQCASILGRPKRALSHRIASKAPFDPVRGRCARFDGPFPEPYQTSSVSSGLVLSEYADHYSGPGGVTGAVR
jgi:hypothetical protein